MSRDLFIGAEDQYPELSKSMIDLLVLGACAQLAHICFLNPDALQTKKKETGTSIKHIYCSVKRRAKRMM